MLLLSLWLQGLREVSFGTPGGSSPDPATREATSRHLKPALSSILGLLLRLCVVQGPSPFASSADAAGNGAYDQFGDHVSAAQRLRMRREASLQSALALRCVAEIAELYEPGESFRVSVRLDCDGLLL